MLYRIIGETQNGRASCGHKIHQNDVYYIKPIGKDLYSKCGKCVDSVKHTKTKKGKNPGQPMCFLTISDSTYSVDYAIVFPDVFGRLKAFCKEDMICLIYGEKRNGSFIIRDIQKLM